MTTDRSTTDERPTIGETYGRATVSSNLRVPPSGRSDADTLIAAGWLDDCLGALLLRLAHEWDAVRGEHGIARAEFDRVERLACLIERSAVAYARQVDCDDRPAWDWYMLRTVGETDKAADLRRHAIAQARTSRALMQTHLKTLREAKEMLYGFARREATKRALTMRDEALADIVGQTLDIHLDATCHQCQGRGLNGGYGVPVTICKVCGGSGQRGAHFVGKDQAQRDFAAFLLSAMERLLSRAAGGIARRVFGHDAVSTEDRASGEGGVATALAGLRAPEAAAD